MSVEIDDRIVRFSVDDSSLVKKGPSVVNMLGKMKEALNFSHSAKGLQDIEKAAKNIRWDSMAAGAEVFTGRISALSIAGITTIQRYTNQALNAVENFAKELTTRPIFTGFSEYEIKMDAIQTILTNTAKAGTTLDDVNRVLANLNQYADLTIYNFAEMTRNIGTFTAAGIGLDDAAAAIKGISNVAAASGVNATKAANAMYQLSQGMAAGTIRLQDWMSIEQAGMGGQLFQDALIETARVHGISIDSMIKKQGSFRYTLQEGWLTAEIMSETLQKFTGDLTDEQLRSMGYTEKQIASIQETAKNAVAAATEVETVTQLIDTMKESVQSGWATSWEYIIGDKQQATETLTRIKDAFDAMIAPSTEARNNALKIWNEFGGREAAIQGFVNIFTGIKTVIDSITGVADAILPDIDGWDLVAFSQGFEKLTRVFKMGGDASIDLEKTLSGLGVVLKFIGRGVLAALTPFKALGGVLTGFMSILLKFTGTLGGWLSGFDAAVDRSRYLSENVGSIYEGFRLMLSAFKDVYVTKLDFGLDLRFDGIQTMIKNASNALAAFRTNLDNGIAEFKTGARNTASGAATAMLQGVSTLVGWIESALTAIGNGIKAIGSGIKAVGNAIFGFVNGTADSFIRLVNAFSEAWSIEAIRDITLSAILLGISKGIKKGFKGMKRVIKGLEAVSDAINTVGDSIKSFNKSIKAKTLLTMAGAIAILAGSMVLLSYVNPDNFVLSFTAVTAFLAELTLVMQALDKLDGTGIGALTIGLVILASAVAIMASAIASISKSITGDNILPVLGALVAIVAGLVGSAVVLSKYVSNPAQLITTSLGLIILASAFKTIAKAIAAFGQIDPDTLNNGLRGLGVMLAEVAAFIRFAKIDRLKQGRKVIAAIAVSMLIMVGAVAILGNMQVDKLIVGLASVAALLVSLGIAVAFMKNANMVGVAPSVLAMALALNMLMIPILALGSINADKLTQGLTALGAVVLGLTIALVALGAANKYIGSFTGVAVALIALSVALNLVITPILILGSIPIEVLGNGLLGIAGALAVFAVAAVVLGPISVSLLAVAGALALLGLSVLGIGSGISALATAFLKLSAITALGATAVTGALTAIIGGLIILIPEILSALGTGIVEMLTAISVSIIDNAGIVLDKLGELLDIFCKWLLDHGPIVIGTVVFLFLELILILMQAIADYTQPLSDAFVEMIIACINSIAKSIREDSHKIIAAIMNLMSAIIEFVLVCIAELLRLIPGVGEELSGMVLGWKESVQRNLAPESMEDIADDAVEGLEIGFRNGAGGVGDAASDITREIELAMSGLPVSLENTGENAGEGLAKGLLAKKKRIVQASAEVAGAVEDAANQRLEIRSPSRRLTKTGKFAGEGIVVGLLSFIGKVEDAGHEVGDTTFKAVEESLKYVQDILGSDLDFNPRITPVVDLTNVRNSAASINRALSLKRPIAMATVAAADGIAESFSSNRTAYRNGYDIPKAGDTYNYYQTINSPKPVNRFEIYRQTKTLISRKKGGG